MRIPRIYIPTPLITGKTVTLSDSAFNHSIKALRLKAGAPLTLFNGEGGEFAAELTDVQKREATAAIGEHKNIERESSLNIILGQCISRGEKMDYTIQKSVELGVNEIVPLFSERCGVRLSADKLDKRLRHWQGVIISACEQCGRNRIPLIHPPVELKQWLELAQADSKLVLAPISTETLSKTHQPESSIALLIGPEGGLTDNEIQSAISSGFSGIQLGPRILCTETAGVTALSVIQCLWGDLINQN